MAFLCRSQQLVDLRFVGRRWADSDPHIAGIEVAVSSAEARVFLQHYLQLMAGLAEAECFFRLHEVEEDALGPVFALLLQENEIRDDVLPAHFGEAVAEDVEGCCAAVGDSRLELRVLAHEHLVHHPRLREELRRGQILRHCHCDGAITPCRMPFHELLLNSKSTFLPCY